jgi:hypothetical protein
MQGVALGICETIASSMGANVKRHVAVIGPGMIQGMADAKPAQREKAVTALNAWVRKSRERLHFRSNRLKWTAITYKWYL